MEKRKMETKRELKRLFKTNFDFEPYLLNITYIYHHVAITIIIVCKLSRLGHRDKPIPQA